MKTIGKICALFALAGILLTLPAFAADSAVKTRVLVVTGGHDFERPQFFKLLEDNPDITFKAVEHPKAHELFKPEHAGEYDMVLLYDMWQEITPEAKENFIALLKNGKGLIAMHHCLAGYQAWPEYENIIGGKYHETKWVENGADKPKSTYLHDVDFLVKVSALPHPITKGLKDFKIHDETYGLTSVNSDAIPLLTTEEPTSGKTIGWAKMYGKGRVFYFALGHDHQAYENPNLRQLLAQAIEWTSGK